MTHPEWRETLLLLCQRDDELREHLMAEGSLNEGYHPAMEAVHRANTAHLRALIEQMGWPGCSSVGSDGAEAAWRIAQHSIGEPAFMREALRLVKAAVERGDAPAWHAAYLDDRIRALEGRSQRYGTQFDWNEEGQMVIWPPVEDPDGLDARRAGVGLPSLAEASARHQATVTEQRPVDLAERRREAEAWARRVGWRS